MQGVIKFIQKIIAKRIDKREVRLYNKRELHYKEVEIMNPMASIRAERGESQYEAAARIGIAQSTYAQIEIGSRRPSVDTAKLIAKEMGFEWTVFFEDGDGREKEEKA